MVSSLKLDNIFLTPFALIEVIKNTLLKHIFLTANSFAIHRNPILLYILESEYYIRFHCLYPCAIQHLIKTYILKIMSMSVDCITFHIPYNMGVSLPPPVLKLQSTYFQLSKQKQNCDNDLL